MSLTTKINSMSDEQRKHILVVEDDQVLRRMIVVALEVSGYQVRSAADGVEAQQLWREQAPDLVITDLQMPVMDGISLVRWIRDEIGSALPVLVLSSMSHQQAGDLAMQAGANQVATKPLQLPQLLAEIETLLSP